MFFGNLLSVRSQEEIEQCGKIGAIMAGNVISNYGARIPEKIWEKVDLAIQSIIE